jgi:hypothetical protein
MINNQMFTAPTRGFKIKGNKDVKPIDILSSFHHPEINIVWSRLIDPVNLISSGYKSLIKVSKLAIYIKTTRKDLQTNYRNLDKYPEMSDEDWQL